MAKIWDREDEPNGFMEMPTRCDCGKWFDLLDGHRSEKKSITICGDCKDAEDEEISHENEIQELKDEIDDAIVTIEDAQTTLNNAKIKLAEYGIIYPEVKS